MSHTPPRSILPILGLLALCVAAASSAAPAAPQERSQEDRIEALAPAETAWQALRQRPGAAARLADRLSEPLARALLRLGAPGVRVLPQQAAAGIAATVLSAAEGAGAAPSDCLELELILRELLPRLVAAQAGLEPPAPGSPAALGDAELAWRLAGRAGLRRDELRDLYCSSRPADCASLPSERIDTSLAALVRSAPRGVLPSGLVLELHASLAVGVPEPLR